MHTINKEIMADQKSSGAHFFSPILEEGTNLMKSRSACTPLRMPPAPPPMMLLSGVIAVMFSSECRAISINTSPDGAMVRVVVVLVVATIIELATRAAGSRQQATDSRQ
jgi:hypothetical protein